MKQLNLYKIVGKDNREILCLSVKNLLQHLRELDVLAVRDEKAILSTLIGELAESIGELSLPEPITSSNRNEKEVPEPRPMGRKGGSVGNPVIEEEEMDIPRPVQKKKPVPNMRAEEEEEDSEDEAEVEEGEGDEEEFKLR